MQYLYHSTPMKYRHEWWLNGVLYPPGTYELDGLNDEYIRDHSGFGPGDHFTPTGGVAGTLRRVHPQGKIEKRSGTSIVYETGSFSGSLAPPFGGVPDFVDAMSYNGALNKLYDKLYQTELNLAVSLGEARESASMIRKGIKALGRIVSTARQARRKLLTNPSLLISEIWLGLKYGWIPAANDVYNMLHHEAVRLQEVQVKARKTWRSPVDYEGSQGGHTWHIRGYHSQRCEIAVWVAPLDQNAFDVARISSLNPLTIAWELMPLSFVVDWVYNIGGYLENMERSFGIGLTFKRGYVTRQRKSSQNALSSTPFVASPWTCTPRVFGSLDNTHKVRTVLGGFPQPALPRFNINLGSQQVMSAAALIRTILLGKAKI